MSLKAYLVIADSAPELVEKLPAQLDAGWNGSLSEAKSSDQFRKAPPATNCDMKLRLTRRALRGRPI